MLQIAMNSLGEVLVASDDLNRVMNEYELVLVKGERLPRGPISHELEAQPPETVTSLPPPPASGLPTAGDVDLLLDLGFSAPQPTAAFPAMGGSESGVSLLENELLALGEMVWLYNRVFIKQVLLWCVGLVETALAPPPTQQPQTSGMNQSFQVTPRVHQDRS